MPHLSRPQAWVLALWSYATHVLQCCGQSQVSAFWAQLLQQKPNTLRQRLREWTWDKAAKQGELRQEVVVASCFAPLLGWVLQAWPAGTARLALALDATCLKQQVVVLSVSVLYQGGAIPVAWQVLDATAPGAWRPHWLALLGHLRGQIPASWQVLVLADRGLFAAWLFRAIQAEGWHPLLRINIGGKCRPAGASEFQPLASLLPPIGQSWSGAVVCFKRAQLAGTLLIQRAEQHADPWLVLTDLPLAAATSAWYRLRAWIEAQFKDFKRGGWQWHHTRMTAPDRIARLWLVLAVAQLHALSLGSQVEAEQPPSDLDSLPPRHIARRTATGRPAPRLLSLMKLGWLAFVTLLIRHQTAPPLRLHLPNLWPDQPA